MLDAHEVHADLCDHRRVATSAGKSLPMARETDEIGVPFRCRTPEGEGEGWDAHSQALTAAPSKGTCFS